MKNINMFKKFLYYFMFVCVLIFNTNNSFGEEGLENKDQKNKQNCTKEKQSNSIVPIKSGNITVNFKDVDIKTVLQYLSEVSGVDIIPSPKVEAIVTMRLRNKPWEVALDIVTRNYGFAYSLDEEKNIIRVMSRKQLYAEEPITEVIFLKYISKEVNLKEEKIGEGEDTNIEVEEINLNIEKLLDAINSILLSNEKVTYLPNANALVITAIPANINVIKNMISKIDKKPYQILIDAKIIEINLNNDEQLGIDWNMVISAQGAKRPITFPFTSAGMLPFLPKVSQEKYLSKNENGGTEFPALSVVSSALNLAENAQNMFSFGTLDASQFTAVLRMLNKRDNVEILSSPRLTTLDNQKAVIEIAEKILLQESVKSTEYSGTLAIQYEEEPRVSSIKLTIVPHANDEGYISVDLLPKVDTPFNFSAIGVFAEEAMAAITYTTREANTQVRVKDGETVFIGGLIKETITKDINKVFILGDLLGWIPLIGKAFKYEH